MQELQIGQFDAENPREKHLSVSDILGKLKLGDTSLLKATILWRVVGSTEALIDINSQKFVIDESSRLKLAGIDTDYTKRKGVIRGVRTGSELNEYLKKFPKLGRNNFWDPRITTGKFKQASPSMVKGDKND